MCFLLPEFELLCSSEDRGDAAGVHLQQGHLGCRVRGEESSTSSLCPTHVSTGQAQLQALCVLGEETLTQCQANATARKHRDYIVTITMCTITTTVPYFSR